jgi:hypothetical protein
MIVKNYYQIINRGGVVTPCQYSRYSILNCPVLTDNVQAFCKGILTDFFYFVRRWSAVYLWVGICLKARPILVHNIDCGICADLLYQKINYIETAR